MKWFMTLGKKKVLLENVISLNVIQALNIFLPLVMIPILESRLGLDRFGLVMYAQYLVILLVTISDFGMSVTAVREIADKKAKGIDYSQRFSQVLTLRMLAVIITILIFSLIVSVLSKLSSDWEVYLLSCGIVVGQGLTPDWFYHGIQKMKLLSIINLFSKVTVFILLFLLINSPEDYLLVPFLYSAGFISVGLVSLVFSFKYVQWKLPNWVSTRGFLIDSKNVFLSNVAQQVMNTCHGVILGAFVNNSVLGVYSAFEKLISASKKLFLPFFQALYPYLVQKKQIERDKYYKVILPITLAVSLTAIILILIFGEWLIGLLYEAELIIENYNLFQTLSLALLFSGCSLFFTNLVIPVQHHFKERMKILGVASFLSVLIAFAAVQYNGLKGIIFSAVLCEFILFSFCLIYYAKLYRKNRLGNLN